MLINWLKHDDKFLKKGKMTKLHCSPLSPVLAATAFFPPINDL